MSKKTNKSLPENNEKGNAAKNAAVEGTDEKSIRGVVYRYKCTNPDPDLNGKYYVGTTPDEGERRKSWDNWSVPYAGKKMGEARKRTEPSDWEYEVIEEKEFSTKEEYDVWSLDKEREYIARYDSFYNGFNGNLGGTGRCSESFTDEDRARVGEKSRNRKKSAESIEKTRKALLGRPCPPERAEKIKKSLTGSHHTPEQNKAQSERMKGIEPVAATAGAQKWRDKNGGGYWKNKQLPPSAIAKRNQTLRAKAQHIKVTDKDGNVICYACQTDAAKATGLKDGSIKYALDKTNGLHAKSGYRFEKICEEEYQAWLQQQKKD